MTQEEYSKLSDREQVSYWTGQLCIAIGENRLREFMCQMIDFHLRIGFERGRQAENQNPS